MATNDENIEKKHYETLKETAWNYVNECITRHQEKNEYPPLTTINAIIQNTNRRLFSAGIASVKKIVQDWTNEGKIRVFDELIEQKVVSKI